MVVPLWWRIVLKLLLRKDTLNSLSRLVFLEAVEFFR